MATIYTEELGFGFCLELRNTALVEKPFAVEFFGTNVFTKTNYFNTYDEAEYFYERKYLEIMQFGIWNHED